MFKNAPLILAVVAMAPVLIAQESCSVLEEQPGIVRVKAPAGRCWAGAIGDSTKQGCGSASFDIEGESIIVANAQKQTPGRWTLTLSLEIEGKLVDTSSTNAEFGIATVEE